MMGRRSAALLCVLLTHALLFVMFRMHRTVEVPLAAAADFASEPITLYLPPLSPEPEEATAAPAAPAPRVAQPDTLPVAPAPAQSNAIASPEARVDWPLEGKKSAERVLAREAEAERIARMFAGPGGTWASLTKRQRSMLSKFRWKKGVVPGVRLAGQPDLSPRRWLLDRELGLHRLRDRQEKSARRLVREHARILRRAAPAADRRRQRHRARGAQAAVLTTLSPPCCEKPCRPCSCPWLRPPCR